MLLAGKVALITGAARGIGAATALELARHGAHLILNDINVAALQQTADAIREATDHIPHVLPYDVGVFEDVRQAFAYIQKEVRQLDILVNNAGVMEDALLGMITPAQVERTMAVNLNAIIYHMQYAARLMTRQKSGAMINISSIMGRVGNAGQVVYAASKAGVLGATKSAAKELAHANIRVNAIAPGFIQTNLLDGMSEAKYHERLGMVRMGRIGQPQEVAQAVAFLASDNAVYITGQVLGVDGCMAIL